MGVVENKVETYLSQEVKKICGVCEKWGTRGNPDRIVILNSRVYFVEVKTTRGSLQYNQKRQIARLINAGANVCVVSGHDGVDEFVEKIKNNVTF